MKTPLKEIKRILDYLEDEKQDYKETDNRDNHIFVDIKKVKNWLQSKNLPN